MLKGIPIGESLMLLIISGVILYFAKLTLDKWDAEEWGLVILGVVGTLFVFSIMVAIVKHLIENENDSME
ncbi:hypothetical protein ACFLU1_04225 [Chloroflexota bacterium]